MKKEITIICDTTNFENEGEEIDLKTSIANEIASNLESVGIEVTTVTIAEDLGDGQFDEPDVFNYAKGGFNVT